MTYNEKTKLYEQDGQTFTKTGECLYSVDETLMIAESFQNTKAGDVVTIDRESSNG